MKSALNMWCFPASWSFEEACRAAAEHGVRAIEVNLSDDGPFTLSGDSRSWQQARSFANDLGIVLPSVSTDLLWKYPLTDSSPVVQRQAKDVVLRMVEMAAGIGADTVLVVPGLVTEAVGYEEAYQRAQEAMVELAEAAAAAGVTIAIENVWNRFLLSPLEFRRWIDEVNHPHVQAYLDIGNVLPNGYPDQWVRILGHRVRRVHVKDFRTDVGNIRGFTTLFAGDVPWREVLSALKEIGYDEYLTAEIPSGSTYASYNVAETCRGLRALCEMYEKN
ncbi:sugar phosphate isomerase/epimerase family protein [Alicyclobacillus acidiphilus]|uniref:sugar phosphate isomerase/epimerase family protein n=1 Tax=Alicyclobacillus acidiphilus TaxID=182455 RepID=UPI00147066FA|nr:sugar phosphate isomerase/epimerase family protein [Alicyclobacillus acidiphilus]